MTPVRVILWAQAAVVCFTGAVAHLERIGFFRTVNQQGLNDYTELGHLALGAVNYLILGMVIFPILFLAMICLRPLTSSASMSMAFLAEILLEFGHFIALLPGIM